MSVLALPRFVALKNKYNGKYLSYRKDDSFLVLNGTDVSSILSKFAIQPAGDGSGLVNVRCCYNNRYLWRNSDNYLVALAAKTEDENTSSEWCTLFEPIGVDDSNNAKQTIRFRHVNSRTYAALYYTLTDALHDDYLCANKNSPDDAYMLDAYEVIDWETLVIFPSHSIALKGTNGKYLGVTSTHTVLEFRETDKNAAMAAFRIEPAGDGSVYIFSICFWRYLGINENGSIIPNIADKSPDNPGMRFTPIKLGGKVIALRCRANNNFLSVINDSLHAETSTVRDETHLAVEELFVSRSIYNIVYHKEWTRVYNETPVICGYGEDTNDSGQQDTIEIPITYKETKTTSWNNSASIEGDVKTTIRTGIPFIAEGEIDIDVGAKYEHQWGGQNDESFERGVKYTATIGPRTRVKVSYIATKGTCDVPFSYTESATYNDGTHSVSVRDDGVYTGVNCYNYSFDKNETPL